MKIFVTGATGFIGSHLIRHLQHRGHEVWALARQPALTSFPSGVHVIQGSLENIASWEHRLKEVDALAHLAAQYRIGVVGRRERSGMAACNVTGTQAVLEAGWSAGVHRMLHVSSTAALGETHGKELDESAQHNGTFRSFYEQTKHVAHGLALDLQRRGAPLCIATPGGAFGPGDRSDLDAALRQFAAGKLPVQVDSLSRFQLCHVDLICDGLARIVEQGILGRNYLLTGQQVSMAELLDHAAKHLGLRAPKKIRVAQLRPLARLGDALRPLGVRLPLTQETLAVMDGSTYTYQSARAQTELNWPWQEARDQFWHQFEAHLRTLTPRSGTEASC